MVRVVHVEGTSKKDQTARKKFQYEDKCAQCGAVLKDSTKVAAHVASYGCLSCCMCPTIDLVTTCKSCNHRSHPQGRGFNTSQHRSRISRKCAPICFKVTY